VLWGKTASMLAETALAARGLLRLDLSDCDWLSAEHLIRCSGLLVELQVTCFMQSQSAVPPLSARPSMSRIALGVAPNFAAGAHVSSDAILGRHF